MSEKISGFVYFEGIIPEKKDKKGELAETEAAYLIQFEIPSELTGKEDWVPKSQVREIKQEGDVIRGKVARWLLERKFNFEMLEVESAQVEVIHPASEEKHVESKKEYERFVGDTPLVEVLKEIAETLKIISGNIGIIIESMELRRTGR